MKPRPKVLVCDDDTLFHLALKKSLKEKFDVRSAYNGDEALVILKNHDIDLLLLDVQMRTAREGLDFIPKLKEVDPDLAIVMASSLTDFETVREAMRLGATDYIPKDYSNDDLHHRIESVLTQRSLKKSSEQKNFEVKATQTQHALIGKSPALEKLRKDIEKIRRSTSNVVIFGETGTGKEVVARQLRGTEPDGSFSPFIAVDSSTIQSSTAESILFGHEKGAFTGAEKLTKGVFEEADGGLVYFDEIANMPLAIQAKLLRVIQEKELTRLGSSKVISLNFRVICATNKNLDLLCQKGEFKDDLLQRLNVFTLELPPLRQRKEDIPALIEHFLQRERRTRELLRFSEDAIEFLMGYAWPGNVRELSNLVSYVATMTDSDEVTLADLPPRLRNESRIGTGSSLSLNSETNLSTQKSFYEQVEDFEKALLQSALSHYEGNIGKMALELGMDRSHAYAKFKQYQIPYGKNR